MSDSSQTINQIDKKKNEFFTIYNESEQDTIDLMWRVNESYLTALELSPKDLIEQLKNESYKNFIDKTYLMRYRALLDILNETLLYIKEEKVKRDIEK